MIHNATFSKQIILWYLNNKISNFPWQYNKTAYTVWLSEIMLQQTQVKTVIPYYKKFIKKFPTIFQLAKTELNEVLYLWSGLGYYKRANNLYKTAKIVVKNYSGYFPKDLKTLVSFPGIGRSTAGAILSLTFNQRYPILDSNVKRILIRYYSLDIDTLKQSVINNKLWSIIETLIPNKNISIFNQAIMDLGRLICTYANPTCNICPIENDCRFALQKRYTQFSSTKNKVIKKSKKIIWWLLLLLHTNKQIWLIQRLEENIWKKLFCFPEFYNLDMLKTWISTHNLYNYTSHNMQVIKHHISNIQLEIHPILIHIDKKLKLIEKNGIWYDLHEPAIIGIPTPVSVILKKLKYINIK